MGNKTRGMTRSDEQQRRRPQWRIPTGPLPSCLAPAKPSRTNDIPPRPAADGGGARGRLQAPKGTGTEGKNNKGQERGEVHLSYRRGEGTCLY